MFFLLVVSFVAYPISEFLRFLLVLAFFFVALISLAFFFCCALVPGTRLIALDLPTLNLERLVLLCLTDHIICISLLIELICIVPFGGSYSEPKGNSSY